jgi:hypothetical protein
LRVASELAGNPPATRGLRVVTARYGFSEGGFQSAAHGCVNARILRMRTGTACSLKRQK